MATQVRIRRRGRIRMLMIAGAVGAMSLVPAGAAFAQEDPYSGEEPQVLPTRIENTQPEAGTPEDNVAGAEAADRQPSSGVLPFTGADITLFLVTGMAALGTGSMVLRRSSR